MPSVLTLEQDALLTRARLMQRAAADGAVHPMLRGRRIVLLCGSGALGRAAFFCELASELGAHVAQVRSQLSSGSSPVQVREMARLLGRLYDAIDCEGLPDSLVREIRNHAGVPVFDSLASQSHPLARLAECLVEPATSEGRRRLVVQAALVAGMV